MEEIEHVRACLHGALAAGRPMDEVLQVSRCLDKMIVAGMKARVSQRVQNSPAKSPQAGA